MPAPVGQTTPLMELLQPLPRKEGRKQPAEPFRIRHEVTAPDSERRTDTATASPVDPMSMETFLALMQLGSPASAGKAGETGGPAPVSPDMPGPDAPPGALLTRSHDAVKAIDMANDLSGGVTAG